MDLREIISLLRKFISFNTSNPLENKEANCNYLTTSLFLERVNSTLLSFVQGLSSFYVYIKALICSPLLVTGLISFSPIEEGGRKYSLGSSDVRVELQCLRRVRSLQEKMAIGY